MIITVEQLSNDQRDAYDDIMRWIERGYMGDDSAPLLTLGGYAGTGKSTLVSLVAEQVNLPAFCAYTGKAASVLRRKLREVEIETGGVKRPDSVDPQLEHTPYCGTIHGLIYRPCECMAPQAVKLKKPCPADNCPHETHWQVDRSICGAGHLGLVKDEATLKKMRGKTKFIYPRRGPDGICEVCNGKQWILREELDRPYDLIVVDEASMVDDRMLRDLRRYEVPILAVGDHGQLPPVGGTGSLMRNPHLRLEQIHRQAAGNPIIALSKMIREEGRLPDRMDGDAVQFGRRRFSDRLIEERYTDASPARMLEMGLACYMNRTRVGLNIAVRRARGFARNGRELPHVGEHIVCLRNIKASRGFPPIANGMRGVLTTDAVPKLIKDPHGDLTNEYGEKARASEEQLIGTVAFPEDEIGARQYEMVWAQFNRDRTYQKPEELEEETGFHTFSAAGNLFDFGYAMTVHKMQGSQVDDLVVCLERPGPVSDEDWKRWLYTAVTRAESKLTLLR